MRLVVWLDFLSPSHLYQLFRIIPVAPLWVTHPQSGPETHLVISRHGLQGSFPHRLFSLFFKLFITS